MFQIQRIMKRWRFLFLKDMRKWCMDYCGNRVDRFYRVNAEHLADLLSLWNEEFKNP